MFQTGLNQLLQQVDSSLFHAFMEFISLLGLVPFVIGFVLVFAFGFDFRKGIVLLNVLCWTALTTFYLKETIDYPRPVEVDHSLRSPYVETTAEDLTHLLPETTFELLPQELLEVTRNDEFKRYGFPSGHTSIQVALWVSLMLLLRKRWTYWMGISMILLTMLSRIYLGYHFLGDVIGGFAIGILLPMPLLRLVKNSGFYLKRTHSFKSISFLALPLILLPFAPFVSGATLGGIMGINLATLLQIQIKNIPINLGYGNKRLVIGFLGSLIFLLAFYLPQLLGLPTEGYLGAFVTMIFCFVGFYGSLELGRRLYLYRN